MINHEAKMKEYAELLIRVGLNVQKGQEILIHSPVDSAPFARLCVQAAYEAGAAEVTMDWSDDFVTREHFLHAEDRFFDTTPEWRMLLMNGHAKAGTPNLFILASDPMNLAEADPDRILRNSRAKGRDLAEFYRLETSGGFPWCIASVPIPSWAEKVFPEAEDANAACEMLWDAIFETVRVDGKGGAVAAWKEHLSRLAERTTKLNAYAFTSLHYRNNLGTDLVVRLPKGHIWMAGEDVSRAGQHYVANMPTEEIFTAPLKNGVDGVVYASMPLVNSGNIIRDFHMVIREGKIVEVHAKEGEEVLKNAISVDEGACYLGEVALIPYDSPISNQGILYYETLFDENASCHLAFGAAYPCLEGGNDMSPEELEAHGLNDSKQHVDFMIGTADLSIIGTTPDGQTVEIFRDGNFCI